jgi:hypothetical protein
MRSRLVFAGLVALGACKEPPPAPEGLHQASAYMVREFYADDLTFGAGVQGFINWFNTEGQDQLGVAADFESTDAFKVDTLTLADLAHLPLDAEILIDAKDDTMAARDPSLARGVVSLAEMACTWKEAEALLARPDQDTVFAGDWEGYERTYLTDVDVFTDASAADDYDAIPDRLDPFADDFDADRYAQTLLLTDNMADPTSVLTSNIEAYPMDLDLRHGRFEVDGEELGVLAILTYNRGAAWGASENAALLQSYSLELNVERPGGRTLRMLTVWAEPFDRSGLVPPDSPAALVYAVNKSLESSDRISQICAGEIEIEDAP